MGQERMPVQKPRERAMYRYNEFDKAFVQARVAQYRDQVAVSYTHLTLPTIYSV